MDSELKAKLTSTPAPVGVSPAGWITFVEASIAAAQALAASGYTPAGWVAFAEAEAAAVAALLAS